MFRTSDVVLLAVIFSAAAFTYKTKHEAESMMRRIGDLETQIQLEKDRIDVLKADWSLLTQPGRLQTLTEIHKEALGLDTLEADRIVEPAALLDIPLRKDDTLMVESGDGANDPVVTGGVRP